MAVKLESAEEFVKTLGEVELLLREADDAGLGKTSANEEKVAVMNKSAVLLLTGKFEAFLEDAAAELLFAINKVGALRRHIPERLLAEHSVNAVQALEEKLSKGDLDGIRTVFIALGRYWTDLDFCSDIKVSCQFNYGKHGDKEVIKLFKRFGFDDVFSKVTVTDDVESIDEGAAPRIIKFEGIINSLTNIRNNILHTDATPSLTTEWLRQQRKALGRFAMALLRSYKP
jgi:hypothetical protein